MVFTGLSSPQCKAGIWWSTESPRNALSGLGKQKMELPKQNPGNPIGIAAKRRMSHVREGVQLVQKAKESSAAVEQKGGRCGMIWDHFVSSLGEKPVYTGREESSVSSGLQDRAVLKGPAPTSEGSNSL